MAVTLKNLSGFQYGVAAAETGINVEKVETATKPEFKTYVLDNTGAKLGFVVGPAEQNITISGEVSGSTGLMAAVFTTAVTLANTTTYVGASGGVYMDSLTVTENRSGLKSMSASFSKNAGIA